MSNFTARPASAPLTEKGERYAAKIAEYAPEALLDALAYAQRIAPEPRWNEEDSEQVRILRAEILRRMAA